VYTYRTDVSISSLLSCNCANENGGKKAKKDNSRAIILFIDKRVFYRHWKMCAGQLTAVIKLYNWLEIPQEY
jgi:hypothetical protein